MPQASTELQNRMIKYFGSIDDYPVIKFLESHGYILERNWFWTKPTQSHNISDDEYFCIQFLIDEWDFGGLALYA